MTRLLLAWIVALTASAAYADEKPKSAERMNVLFIAIDDLRDWVGYLGYTQVKTPNLDRLAARGVAFTRSYCAAPVCNASRAALLSGLRPGSTGVYENNADWRQTNCKDVVHLSSHFMASGYKVMGAGKIYHEAYAPPSSYWHHFAREGIAEGARGKKAGKEAKGFEGWGYGNFQIGSLPGGDDSISDYGIVSYAIQELGKPQDKPFFLACGVHKPHLPFRAPKKYFDLYPLDKIELPKVMENDLADIPPVGLKLAKPNGDHKTITEAGKWKEVVQAYLATISYCDAMIGRLIDAFDKSPHAKNTLICLWSDHGWHLGEKQHWRKFALWEEATRSPMLFVVPGLTKAGSRCDRTVDFMGIYPTLCDLCQLPTPSHVQGTSFKSLLGDPAAKWDQPAVTTYLRNNHAVRTDRWRYIRYEDGGEELYDHASDAHEWTNLARKPEHASLKAELAKFLPKDNKPDAGTKKKKSRSSAT